MPTPNFALPTYGPGDTAELDTLLNGQSSAIDAALLANVWNFGGTDAQRLAMVAPKLREGVKFRTTDTDQDWFYDGANWRLTKRYLSLKTNAGLNYGTTPVDVPFQLASANQGFTAALPVTQVAIPDSGDYKITGAATSQHAAATYFNVSLLINGVNMDQQSGSQFPHVNTFSRAILASAVYTIPAGQLVKLQVAAGAAGAVLQPGGTNLLIEKL